MIKTMIVIFGLLILAFNVYAEEDIVSLVEQQSIELDQKEEVIKKETERLKTLKKEVEEDIVKYTRLLKQIEKSLKQAEETGNKRLRHVAKAYESMPPEDAASRLSGLDNKTAVQILLKMNSKKAGLVIGMMEAKKATKLTKEIAKLKK
jgi:flagellar motility protein MotE (MotC chaperone)